MSVIRTYRSILVNQVDVDQIVSSHVGHSVHVGIDVGKRFLYVVLRWSGGSPHPSALHFDAPWKVTVYFNFY
ncbi:MAG: hypothetical protein LBG58_07030 [Planctomycetaceae bacterium]|jgi:hypothetical protein|nr:hypothetical protein [Planctomycetaceae bacterium]